MRPALTKAERGKLCGAGFQKLLQKKKQCKLTRGPTDAAKRQTAGRETNQHPSNHKQQKYKASIKQWKMDCDLVLD